jgi:hypothetical protein
MIQLAAWASRHNVSPLALAELQLLFLCNANAPRDAIAAAGSETAVQNLVRLEASRRGDRLYRNNVGVLRDERNIPVRFGLANDSATLNARIKSSDLIGIRQVLITSAHVGSSIGQFWSVECKHPAWKYKGTEREIAQLAWMKSVVALGGHATFSTGEI